MAAVVQIRRWTGSSGSPTQTNISSINTRANAADAHTTTDTASPIQIPGAGSNYSYWVSTRLYSASGLSGTIDNIRWHTDGTANFGTGIDAVVGQAAAYIQATGSAGTGDVLNSTNYSGLTPTTPNDAFTNYPTATALSVTGSATTNTDAGNFVVYQITVDSTAGPGASSTETFTWLYDET